MTRRPAILRQMSVLGDPLRSRILLVLERAELNVVELCGVLQSPQSTVSRHLKALADAGWLGSRADGTNRRYAMKAGGLPAGPRALWLLVRKDIVDSLACQLDERRLAAILAARRTRSQEFFAGGGARWDELRDDLFGRGFLMPALLGLLGDDMVVADLGCGTGQVAQALAPLVAQVIAVDASAVMLRAAKKRLAEHDNVELRPGTLEALPLEDATLDAATMFLVLHHVDDPARAVTEVARALKPGGRLIIVDMLPHDREEYRAQMGHLWLGFRDADVIELLNGAGFEGVRLTALPADTKAKGPALFAARAVRRGALRTARQTASQRR